MIEKILIATKGVAMGAADVVPGVSGGTIALLTGIYPRLIDAITGLNIRSLKMLLSGNIKGFWISIDGSFILPLLIGIGLAFAVLAHPIKFAISNHPIPTWSFFFGLIIASAVLIINHMCNKKIINYLWLIPGIAVGFYIGSLTIIAFPSNQTAVFIAGMLAICAMILPGISGSFILVLLGMYQTLITAVAEREILILLTFMGGAIIGLLGFSRVIKWTLHHFYQQALFFLSGLMLGSLVKVWPWKSIQTERLINVLPSHHSNPQLSVSIGMMVLAIVLVFSIDAIGRKFIKE